MSKELDIYTGEVLTEEEQKALNLELDHIITAHKNNRQEINKLVFECVSAMSEADSASDELSGKGFFSGLWGAITGSNRRLQNKININRAAAQYASQQCLQKLAEQNLMTFDLITAVNNKLNASLIKVDAEFNKVYAVRKSAPLIAALGDNENFLASDIPAILKYTNKYILIEENNIAVLEKNKITIYDENLKEIDYKILEANWTVEQAEKCGYDHFMLKEINEQPKALLDTIEPRIVQGVPDFERDGITDKNFWKFFDRVYIVGCGTSMHAAMIGKRLIEDNCRIPVECEIASEFRYKNPILTEKTLSIFISQSGETADTLAALNLVKEKGYKTLAIVNVNGSSIARNADYVIYTYAGPEISVASTKAYSVQMAIMYLITFKIILERKIKDNDYIKLLIKNLLNTIDSIKDVLNMSNTIKDLCIDYKEASSIFFIGRDLDYYQVMEGALKMKEISYIHCEAYAGGELKHGAISLITDNTPVVALAIQEKILSKMISNTKEVISRGANVLLFAKEGIDIDKDAYRKIVYLPKVKDMFMPIVSIAALQLLAYHTAVISGCDVDKPRNLAKSVTVE